MKRRSFLGACLAAATAPYVVTGDGLMQVCRFGPVGWADWSELEGLPLPLEFGRVEEFRLMVTMTDEPTLPT
jgi:hypothetical protein